MALEQAHIRLEKHGFRESQLTNNNIFVKIEPKNKNWVGTFWEDVKPRLIVSCTPIVKVALGPLIVSFTQALKHAWNSKHYIFFECGSTADVVATWFNNRLVQFGEESLFMSDFSSCDNTHSDMSLSFITDLIMEKCHLTAAQQRMLRSQELRQKLRSRRGVRASRPAFLKSGVPNTTLYNSIINAALFCTAALSLGAKPGVDFAIMIRGDDNLAFLKPQFQNREHFESVAQKLGFKLKVSFPKHVPGARFCSMAFYPTPNGYYPGPTMKCLAKMAYTGHALRKGAERAHLRGVALGLLAGTAHIPLLADYVQALLRYTAGAKGREMHQAVKESQLKYLRASAQEQTPESDTYLASMYNVPLAWIVEMRQLITTMHAPGFYASVHSALFWHAVLEVEA